MGVLREIESVHQEIGEMVKVAKEYSALHSLGPREDKQLKDLIKVERHLSQVVKLYKGDMKTLKTTVIPMLDELKAKIQANVDEKNILGQINVIKARIQEILES